MAQLPEQNCLQGTNQLTSTHTNSNLTRPIILTIHAILHFFGQLEWTACCEVCRHNLSFGQPSFFQINFLSASVQLATQQLYYICYIELHLAGVICLSNLVVSRSPNLSPIYKWWRLLYQAAPCQLQEIYFHTNTPAVGRHKFAEWHY